MNNHKYFLNDTFAQAFRRSLSASEKLSVLCVSAVLVIR